MVNIKFYYKYHYNFLLVNIVQVTDMSTVMSKAITAYCMSVSCDTAFTLQNRELKSIFKLTISKSLHVHTTFFIASLITYLRIGFYNKLKN